MEVKAQAKYVRMSPKKVRLVIDVVRGMDIDDALIQLSFLHKGAAQPVKKLIESAIANALHNDELARNNLYIKEIVANMGPSLKRWMPRAFGRAAMIYRRSTHIRVVLGERVLTKGKKSRSKKGVSVPAPQGLVKDVSSDSAVVSQVSDSAVPPQTPQKPSFLRPHDTRVSKKDTAKKSSTKIFQRKSQ